MRGCVRVLLPGLLALSYAAAAPARPLAPRTDIREHRVRGTVVRVRPHSDVVKIRQDNLLGRLRVQVKSYRVREPGAMVGLRPGDRITAVFSTRDDMLHRVRRAAAGN